MKQAHLLLLIALTPFIMLIGCGSSSSSGGGGTSSPQIYCDLTATSGDGSGSSWANACLTVNDAIAAAGTSGKEIWVADGTYLGQGTSPIAVLRDNISLYGGFEGLGGLEETTRAQRNVTANPTILGGGNTIYTWASTAADEDYVNFGTMSGFMNGTDWAIIEKVKIPTAAQVGWHFFRGEGWQDKVGDVAIQIQNASDPAQVYAWVRSPSATWVTVQMDKGDGSNLAILNDTWVTICLQYDFTAETLVLYVNGELIDSASVAPMDDSTNTNNLFFGGQDVDPGESEGDLYSECDIEIAHQAWLQRKLTAAEIEAYDGAIDLSDPALFFATDITAANINDASTGGRDGVNGNSPVYASETVYPSHVVYGNTVTGCTIDGLAIVEGSASGASASNKNGGGIYLIDSTDITISNCTVSDNEAVKMGGGIYADTLTNLLIEESTIIECQSTTSTGGGICLEECDTSTIVSNCRFMNNTALDTSFGLAGAAHIKGNSSSVFTNCIFTGNQASYGGAIAVDYADYPNFYNCTIAGNEATYSGGTYGVIYVRSSGGTSTIFTMTNCILWDNTGTLSYHFSTPTNLVFKNCDVQTSGGSTSWDTSVGKDNGGNLDADPLFTDADGADNAYGTTDDDLTLSVSTSPVVDKGFGDNYVMVPELDIIGNPRSDVPAVSGDGTPDYIDMGAYEYLYD